MNRSTFIKAMLTGSALMLAQASSVSAADPFISEVMSANDTTLRDSFSNSPDWIEIYNPDDQPFSLADWSLTDDPQDLQKWTFPKVSIDARPVSYTHLTLPTTPYV